MTVRTAHDDARDVVFDILSRERKRLQERLEAEVLHRLGTEVTLRRVDVEHGSVIVSISLVSRVAMTLAAVSAQLDALVRASVDAVTDAVPPVQVWGVSGYWSPSPALVAAPAAPAAAAEDPGGGQIGKWLLTAGAFAVATLAVLKVSDADLNRARLDHPHLMSGALGVIVFATLLGVLWPAWANRGTTTRAAMAWLTVAVIFVGAAVTELSVLTSETLSSVEKPHVDATLKSDAGGTRLVGTVTADGVNDKTSVYVRVFGVGPGSGNGKHPRWTCAPSGRSSTLYATGSGADRDGKAEVKLDVPVPSGRFKEIGLAARIAKNGNHGRRCGEATREVARTSFVIAAVSSRPRLVASWKTPPAKPPVLSVEVRAAGLKTDDRVLLSIRRLGSGGKLADRLYVATLSGDDSGVLDQAVGVALPASSGRLCVVATKLGDTTGDKQDSGGVCNGRAPGVAAVLVSRPPSK